MGNPIKSLRDLEYFREILANFLGSRHFSFKVLFYVFLLFIAAAWLPQILGECLEEVIKRLQPRLYEWGNVWLWKLLIIMIILGFFVYLARKMVKHKGKITVVAEDFCSGKVLAIFLSPLGRVTPEEKGKIIQLKEEIRAGAGGAGSRAELRRLIEKSNWKMSLLAIEHHRNTLTEVVAITSIDEGSPGHPQHPGSNHDFPLFKEVFEILLDKENFVKEFGEGAIDFEEAGDAFEAIDRFYEEQTNRGIKKGQIVIDITGGKKTSSIGGALATLSLGRKFQYVSTTDEEVKSYDIAYIPPDD